MGILQEEDRDNGDAERGMVLRLSSDFLGAPDLCNAIGRGPSRPSLMGLVWFECVNPRLKSWVIVGCSSGTNARDRSSARIRTAQPELCLCNQAAAPPDH